MAISAPVDLGIASGNNVNGLTLTTTVAIPAGALVVVFSSASSGASGPITVGGNAATQISLISANFTTLVQYYITASTLPIGTAITYPQSFAINVNMSAFYVTGHDPDMPIDLTSRRGLNGAVGTQPSIQLSGVPTMSGCLVVGYAAMQGGAYTFTQDTADGFVSPPTYNGGGAYSSIGGTVFSAASLTYNPVPNTSAAAWNGAIFAIRPAPQIVVTTLTANAAKAVTTLSLNVPAGGIPAGSLIYIAAGSTGTITSVNDTAANTYTVIHNPTVGGFSWFGYCWNSKALVGGNSISVNMSGSAALAVSGLFATGVQTTSNPRLGTADQSASGTAVTMGPSQTPTRPGSLIIAGCAVNGPSGNTFTENSVFLDLQRAGTTGGSAASNMTIQGGYIIINTAQTFTATLSASQAWGGGIDVFLVAADPTAAQIGGTGSVSANATVPPKTVQASARIAGAGGALANPVRGPVAASALIAGTGGAPVNYITNPRAQGAVVGTPGTLPTAWQALTLNGTTQSVVGSGVQADGTPYCDIRFSGTPTGTYVIASFNGTAATWISSVPSNVPVTISAYMAMVGGSLANITDGVYLSIRTNAAPILNPGSTFTPTATLTRYSYTFSQVPQSNLVSGGFYFNVTAGLPIDITLRFALPQLEIGPVATAPILPALTQYAAQERGIFANASGGRDVSPNHFALSFTPNPPRQNYTGDVGVQFTPAVALTFNRIGIRCPVAGTGIHTVFIRDVTGNAVLQSATIDLTGATPGVYYYTTLPQTTLTAGNVYYLATTVTASDGQLWADQGPTMLRGVVGGSVRCANSAGGVNPGTNVTDSQYYGLDLDLVTTPAVANALVAGLGGTTNWIYNPRLEGAVPGTPGTLPIGWPGISMGAGLAWQITGTGTEGGLSYVDLRIYGTTTGPTNSLAFNLAFSYNPVTVSYTTRGISGETWTNSVYIKLQAGAFPTYSAGNVGVHLMTYALDAANGVLSYGWTTPQTFVPTNAPLIDQQLVGTGIGPYPTMTQVESAIWVYYDVLQAIDFTLRIASPQLERGPVSSPIWPPAGSPQVSTRALLAAPGIAINASAQIDGTGGTTNYVRNPRAINAAPGTPGTLPSAWNVASLPAQLTQQVVGVGLDAYTGCNYIDVRYSGTTIGIGQFYLYVENGTFPFGGGSQFINTVWLSVSGGTLANITNLYFVSAFQPTGQIIVSIPVGSVTAIPSAWGTTGVAPSGTRSVQGGYIQIVYAAGAVDFTLRISGAQLERGSVRTPLILPPVGTWALTTRALLAAPGSFTPTGATINGTGSVGATIAPVAVPTGAVIAGGEANRVPLLQGVAPVSTDIVPPPGAGGIVFKHTRVGTTGDNNCGVAWTNGMPLVPYAFKVMVWIPAGWGGTLVNITTEGNVSAVVGAPANLSLTNQWQLVTGHAIRPTGEVALVTRINDATATPIYTAAWQAIPDTVVAAPTIFGNTALGGVGSVTATATVLATAVSRIYAGGPWNYIPNPRSQGAIPGTFPSGQLPTGWQPYAYGSGVTVIGNGTDATTGLPYVDVRFFGTTTGGYNVLVFNYGQYWAPLGSGAWTGSLYAAMVGGDLTNITSVRLQIRVEGQLTNDVFFTPTATLARYTNTYNSTASYAAVAVGIAMFFPTGVPIDITLRFGPQQLELGPVATPQIYPPAGVVGWSTRPLTVDGRNFIPTGARLDGRGGQTNYVRNPRAEGATPGTPGTLPTYWTWGAVAGISRSVVGSGVENGIPYIDLRWFGTQTQAGVASNGLGFEAGPFVAPGRPGQQYTQSFYQKLVGGSVSGINNFYFVIYEYDASGNFLTTTNYFHPPAPPGTTLDANRTSYTGTPTQATTAWIIPIWYLETSQNAVIDITVRIGGVQLEIGPVRTPLILPPVGVPGASSRALLGAPTVTAQTKAWINASDRGQTFDPLSPLFLGQQTFLSNANCTITRSPVAPYDEDGARGDGYVSVGKFYAEFTPQSAAAWNSQCLFGITDATTAYWDITGSATNSSVFQPQWGIWTNGATNATLVGTWVAQTAAMAVDLVNRRIWFRVLPSGLWNGSASGDPTVPSTGIDISTLPLSLTTVVASGGTVAIGGTINLGSVAFLGAVPAGFSGFPVVPGGGHVSVDAHRIAPGAARIAGIGNAVVTTTSVNRQALATIPGQGGATNWLRNPRGENAAIGTYPSNTNTTTPTWWDTDVGHGLQRQIIGNFVVDGIAVVRMRAFGTPDPDTDPTWAIGNAVFEYTPGYTGGPFLGNIQQGQTITRSFYLRLVAGSWANTQRLAIWGITTDATNTGAVAGTNPRTNITPPGVTLTRYTDSYTQSGGVAPYYLVGFGFIFDRVDPPDYIDVTFDIGGGQIELGARLTSLILPPQGTLAASVRGVEALGVATLQAAARINGEGLIGADSSFVGQARANATIAGVGNIIITGLRQRFATHAVIHGTGSVTVGFAAKEAAKARLLGVGGVQATAAVAHPTIARIRGVGQIAAVSQRVRYASATIAGTGRLFATAFPIKSGNVTIGGAGLLRVRDTIIAVLQTAAATITGTAVVHVQGRRAPPCDGLIEAEGNVYATATVRAAGQALVAGTGTVDAHGTAWRHAEALLDGEGEVRGLLNHRPVASAGISGVGQVAADGTPIRQTLGAAALIAGVGRVRADAFRAAVVAAEAMIAGLGAVLASGLRAAVVNVDKTIAGVGNVRATVSRVIVAAGATIAGTGTARANGSQIGQVSAEAQIDGSSWLRVDSVTVTQVHATATIQGVGGAVAHAARSQHARATIAGASSVTARGSVWAPALALIAGAGAFVAGHRKAPFPVHAKLGGEGSVSAVAHVLVSTHVRIAGHADMADVAATLHAEAQVRISVHGWLIERAKSQLEAHVRIAGQGHLAFDGEQMSHRHTSAVIRGIGHIETDAGTPREQIAAQGVFLPPSLVGVSVL